MAIRHEDLWRALDTLAAEHGLTPSGLARAAGLDATSFNRSKRTAADGRLRWPSTESLSLALAATGATLESFSALVAGGRVVSHARRERDRRLRVTPFRDGISGARCFDAAGAPQGAAWEHREPPPHAEPGDYGLAIETETLAPALCQGDLVMVSPEAPVRVGDRVVACVGEDVAPALLMPDRKDETVSLLPLEGGSTRIVPGRRVRWIHRITWIGR